jgi:hypothetical protein
MSLTADSYMQMLDRLELPERVEWLEKLLSRPLEDGVRPVLRRAFLDLTERENIPANTRNHTEREDR